MLTNVHDYIHHLNNGKKDSVSGLVGRILRGARNTSPDPFETLTNEPEKRKLILLMDSVGLSDLLGKTTKEALMHIGYTNDYISELVNPKNPRFTKPHDFMLVVMPSESMRLARWHEVLQSVTEAWPELKNLPMASYANILRKKPSIEYWEYELRLTTNESIKSFKDLKAAGEAHPLYMTPARMLEKTPSALQMRIFLYLYCFLTELYSGDGRTYTPDGNPGLEEYVIPNKKISDIPGARLYKMKEIPLSEF